MFHFFKSIHVGNGICHTLVQFNIKAQKLHYIRTCKCRILQKNLQLCHSVILNVESHCNSTVKPKILFYSFSLSTVSLTLPLFQLYIPHLSLSLSLSLSDFSLSLCSPSGHCWPPLPSNTKPRLHLTQRHGLAKIGDRGGIDLDRQRSCYDVCCVCGFDIFL